MTNIEAFDLAKRKARYGHRDWLVWRDRSGHWSAEQRTASAIKRAMLATGTQRHWYAIDGRGIGYIQRWRLGLLDLRNARRYGT